MAGSAAQRRAPARGGLAGPRGRGGRGGAGLEPGARVARAVAAVALAAAHPLDASRRGTGVAGARARWLRARSGMVGHAAGVLVDCVSVADSTDAVLRVGVGRAKWATGLVVGPDVLYQLAPQIRGRREDAAREAVALDPWMRGEPRGDRLGLMRREVVGNEVDRAAPRVGGHELIEEGQELDTRMPGDRAAFDMTRADLERGVERERSVADVLEAVPLRPAGRQRQHGIPTVERLDGCLLIHAKHRRVRRGLEVEADDVGRLLLEVRVGTRDVA